MGETKLEETIKRCQGSAHAHSATAKAVGEMLDCSTKCDKRAASKGIRQGCEIESCGGRKFNGGEPEFANCAGPRSENLLRMSAQHIQRFSGWPFNRRVKSFLGDTRHGP